MIEGPETDVRRQTWLGTTNSGNAAGDFDYDKDGLTNLVEFDSASIPPVPRQRRTACAREQWHRSYTPAGCGGRIRPRRVSQIPCTGRTDGPRCGQSLCATLLA